MTATLDHVTSKKPAPTAPSHLAADEDGTGWRQTVRMSDQRSWTVEHFSQANPVGEGQGDVPALLRRVADSIDALGEVEVQDLVLHIEVAESGAWPSLTVYFHRSTALRLVP